MSCIDLNLLAIIDGRMSLALDNGVKVYVCENIIRDIIRNCPNNKDIGFQSFSGLKTLKIAKLDKLQVLGVRGSWT